MSVAIAPLTIEAPTHGRDPYRFGWGREIVLQPGTLGWTAEDLEDPEIARLWQAGRYEIIEGVLTVMPAAYFRGGNVAQNLVFLLRPHFVARGMAAQFAPEVDIAAAPARVFRTDYAVVIGEDLPKFRALRFPEPKPDWRDHALTIPPTLVIESISEGHESHDRRTKRRLYAEFGIPNYWIVDAYSRRLECLVLRDGTYREDAVGRDADVVRPTAFPGLDIPLTDVWGD